jgi:23S rRNA (guanosine2251-2'-O)-methyltransferase
VSDEVVYGRNPVRELLRAGRRPAHRVLALPQLHGEPWLEGVRVERRDRAELARAAGTGDHQGVVALTDPYPYAEPRDLLAAPGAIVVLDGAQDPRNLGAIVRVAEAAGAAGLVIARRGTPGVTATVCKASAGAVEHLPIARVGSIAAFVHDAAGAGRAAVGADAGRGEDYATIDWEPDALLVMGSEGEGLRPRVRDACTVLARIPMAGHVDSLNLSVAAGVLLFRMKEALRGR